MSAALDGQLRALNAVGGAPSKSKLPEYSLSLFPAGASLAQKPLLVEEFGWFLGEVVLLQQIF